MKECFHLTYLSVLKSWGFIYKSWELYSTKSTFIIIEFPTFVVERAFGTIKFLTCVVERTFSLVKFPTFLVESAFCSIKFLTFVIESTFERVKFPTSQNACFYFHTTLINSFNKYKPLITQPLYYQQKF